MGVHPLEVLSTLNAQNQTVYPGYFNSGDERIRVKISDNYQTIEDIRNLIIQGHEQDQLRLGDIAAVTRGYRCSVHSASKVPPKDVPPYLPCGPV